MKYLLFIFIPIITFSQVTEKKFGDLRVRDIIPVITSGSTFEDAVTSVTDTAHYTTIPKVFFLQDSLDDKLNRSEYTPGGGAFSIEESFYTEDVRTPVSSIRLPGSGAPLSTAYLGGEVLELLQVLMLLYFLKYRCLTVGKQIQI